MGVFLGITGFILLIVTVILLLPISVIIKKENGSEVVLLFKILFMTFGEKKENDKPKDNSLKEFFGVSKLNKKSVKTKEFIATLREDISLIMELIKRLLGLLKKCKVKVLKIDIVCAEDDAAKTAINYGICYSIISPIINLLHGSMKVCKKGEKINIYSDFNSQNASFEFETVIVSRAFRVISAFLSLAYERAKRGDKEQA